MLRRLENRYIQLKNLALAFTVQSFIYSIGWVNKNKILKFQMCILLRLSSWHSHLFHRHILLKSYVLGIVLGVRNLNLKKTEFISENSTI